MTTQTQASLDAQAAQITQIVNVDVPGGSGSGTGIVTPGVGSFTDGAGKVYTIDAFGNADENGNPIPGGSGTSEMEYYNGNVYGQDSTTGDWYTWNQTNWQPSAAPTSVTSTPTLTPTPSPAPAPIPPATRNPSTTPFASNSVFNLPLGSGAQWQANAQLESAGVYVNTDGNYNEPIYTGAASDPLVTVTNDGSAGGGAGTFEVHIPAGAEPAVGSDETLSVDDTTTDTWYSFGGFQWTSATTATARQGSGESDYGSGIQVDNSNWDEGVGTLTGADLAAGTIDHMLRVEVPTTMLESWDPNSTTMLAPYAWPQTEEDGFANGNGVPPGLTAYSGTVPYGITMGIPASAVEPADVAANPGANMLWQALQDHGAMVRDSAGPGNSVVFQTDQNVEQNNPLIQGMEQYGQEIMSQVQILTNQGPNSVNGGGAPIVPLDPALGDAPAPTPTPTPAPTPAPTPTPTLSPNGTIITPGSGSFTDTAGNVYTIDAAGNADENGKPMLDGAGTSEMEFSGGLVYGQDVTSKNWYTWNQTGWQTASTPPAGTGGTGDGTGGTPTGSFHVSNGQIIGPSGEPFVARGIAVLGSEMDSTSPASIISQFPGINSISLALGADGDGYATAPSNADIEAWVNQATALGLTVMLSDYVPGQPSVRTGSDLQASLTWYASLAAIFANNPNVWWTTENEVTGDPTQEDQGIYNAIRGAGNNSMIFIESQNGPVAGGFNPSILANMTNVGYNIHVYPWEFDTSQTSQSYYDNFAKSLVTASQNFAQSADGVMPVLMGEGGDSSSGSGGTVDPNGLMAVQGIIDATGGPGGYAGYDMWIHDWHNQVGQGGSEPDTLVAGNGSLTDYGVEVAAAIKAGAGASGTGTGGTGGGTNPSGVVTGTGSDSLVLLVSEDAYQGDAQFTVSVDGKQLGGTFTTTAIHGAGQEQTFTFNGDWAPGQHTVAVDFLNDAYGGTAATDRNLYVGSETYDGVNVGKSLTLDSAGTQSFAVTDTTALPAPPLPAFPTATDGFVTPGAGTFTAAGNTYVIDGAGNADQNGAAIPGGGGTSAMASVGSSVFGQDATSGQWYSLNGTNWTATAPMLIDATSKGSVNEALPRAGTVTENGDTFVLSSGNVIKATIGAGNNNVGFIAAAKVTLTGGSGKSEALLAGGGTNTVTAGSGSLDVTAGGGADAYVFHAGDGLLTVEDFSIAKGDTLTIDKSLQGSMTAESDGHGGTALVFATNSAIDLKGVAAAPAIHWN